MTSKEKKLVKQIINLLKEKNLYTESDDMLIQELIFLQRVIEQAKTAIETQGILVNVRTSDKEPLLQKNQALNIYNESLKALTTICTKLAISPQERSKLKLIDKQTGGFDLNSFLNEN